MLTIILGIITCFILIALTVGSVIIFMPLICPLLFKLEDKAVAFYKKKKWID